jgi:xanthine dehydrogenase YagR molybdenum-binding subunit
MRDGDKRPPLPAADDQTRVEDVPGAPSTGKPIRRLDAIAKVTGTARYAAEFNPPGTVHAVMVCSTIANGRVASIDVVHAQSLPGVLSVMSHVHPPVVAVHGKAALEPPAGRVLALLQDDRVHYSGQPIALVVAESLEQARSAARVLHITYVAEPAQSDFTEARKTLITPTMAQGTDSQRGRAPRPVSARAISASYSTPIEHHNPMEPHATVAVWNGDSVTLHDSTQAVTATRNVVAKTLGIPREKVHVICSFTGGGFGCKGSAWSHVLLAAIAARDTGRPVKLVLDRSQMFGPVGARPQTLQTIGISTDGEGHIEALSHDSISATSMLEDWTEPCAVASRILYASSAMSSSHRLARMNIGTPTFTRAPGEASGTFALEVAMDEMAVRLGIDPVAFRLKNYAETEPSTGRPFSSKQLRECYRVGVEQFGWAERVSTPGTLKTRHGTRGLGMATATYRANRGNASAVARLLHDGTVRVESGTQDLGTGTYTIMTQIAADALGYPLHKVDFHLGDTEFPEAPGSGGSQSAAGVGPAVQLAASALRAKIIAMAIADPASPLAGLDAPDVTIMDGWVSRIGDARRRDAPAALLSRSGGGVLEATVEAHPGEERKNFAMHSFGAVFVDLHVDDQLGLIRVERVLGVYDIGTLLNATTGKSQLVGGIVWGIGMALLESSELDRRTGRLVNANFAEYHVPVNADIRNIDAIVVPGHDPYINSLGARGIGEIGITGVPAAISNAVYNATGRRVRKLPITLDDLIV